jgi:hypothetical protein
MADIEKPTIDASIYDSAGTRAVDIITDGAGKNRLADDTAITQWFGSTVPTIGQKTMANSIPVTLPSDQTIGVNGTIATMESETAAIRAGKAYFIASQTPVSVAAGSTYDILVKTQSATRIHLRDISINVNKNNNSGIQKVATYEGSTVSANGTALTLLNNDRAVATASNCLIYSVPTVTALGTKFYEYILHSDWETYVAPSYTSKFELILKKDTNYIIRITNDQNQTIVFTWFFFLYELEPY